MANEKTLIAPVTVWVLYSLDKEIDKLEKAIDSNISNALLITTTSSQRENYFEIIQQDRVTIEAQKKDRLKIQRIQEQMMIQLSKFVVDHPNFEMCCPVPPNNCICYADIKPLDLYVDFPEYNVEIPDEPGAPVVSRVDLPNHDLLFVCQDIVNYANNKIMGALKIQTSYPIPGDSLRMDIKYPKSITFSGKNYRI